MSFDPAHAIYIALGFYVLGTLTAMASLMVPTRRLQHTALVMMIAGFVAHTIWIGNICVRTGHPPLTNLAESSAFLAWAIFAVDLALWIRYRVYAANFFVYPLVLLLLMLSAIAGAPFEGLDPSLRSSLFTTHIFLTTLGVAGLLIGLSFGVLAALQDRDLRSKQRSALWEWIPSLSVCRRLSDRSLAIGFVIYTVGLIAGVLWSYRTNTAFIDLVRVKQIGAVVAWILFAAILQSSISGVLRGKRMAFMSAGAFVAIIVSILGIART